jgi:uncharacterized protein (DUF1501 family)
MDRREFIIDSTIIGLGTSLALGLDSCRHADGMRRWEGKRLVILQLDGGNDGHFSLFNRGNEELFKARPKLQKSAAEGALQVGGEWLLNRNLGALEEFISRKELIFLPWTGYPKSNTSHFKSAEIWESGRLPGSSTDKTGWLGRHFDAVGAERPIVSLHSWQTLFDKGTTSRSFIWHDDSPIDWYDGYFNKAKSRGMLPLSLIEEYETLKHLGSLRLGIGFSKTELGDQFSKAVAVIRERLPFKAIHIRQGGFDTHLGQSDRLPSLYRDLAYNLRMFRRSLIESDHWKDTMIFVYSEFGRTLNENRNGGTDHGTYGLAMLINDRQRFHEGLILDVPIDYRDIQKHLIENCL